MPETGSAIIARVREKAAENQNYVYQTVDFQLPDGSTYKSCAYFDGGSPDDPQPSCLIGWGLKPDVGPDDFNEDGRFHWEGTLAVTLLGDLRAERRVEIADRQIAWLNRVQSAQDAGLTWGKAVADADQHYPLDEQ